MLDLTCTRLALEGVEVREEPLGDLYEVVRRHLEGAGPAGLVVLGRFGSGKTQLCEAFPRAEVPELLPATAVPLRVVARHSTVEEGLRRVVGARRLEEARAGERVLLLDGLDEMAAGDERFPASFEDLVGRAGPRWILTSRPGHFRTDVAEPEPCQVDVLSRPDLRVVLIDDLSREIVRTEIGALPGGRRLLESVEGLEQLSRSPLLLHVVHAALPHIDSGRPIQPWGVFDAWIRFVLASGPGHEEALEALADLAWRAFRDRGIGAKGASFTHEEVARLDLPPTLRALFVTDLDGAVRFGHRSLWEFLVAGEIAPRLRENQGQGPDALTGLRLTEAMRAFLVGRVPPMPVVYENGRVRVPRGNFVAGGERSPDERPVRIAHLDRPVWIARAPVTNQDWARFLEAVPDERRDVHYLTHWGPERRPPAQRAREPVYHLWPEDADRYAAWAGARLPTADEWEKAVRGIDGRYWPWGDGWKAGHAATAELGLSRPLPIHALGAQGETGLFGAIGGVFEYTASPWRGRPDRGRVVMGGCFTHPRSTSRASLRLSHTLSGFLKAGLRLAWDAPEER